LNINTIQMKDNIELSNIFDSEDRGDKQTLLPASVESKDTTKIIRKSLMKLILDNEEQFEVDILMLTPKERLDFLAKVLPFVCAKAEVQRAKDDGSPIDAEYKDFTERVTILKAKFINN